MRGARGLTLIECMVLLVILGITAVGVAWGMQAMTGGATANDREEVIAAAVTSELETLRATPFTALAAQAGTTTVQLNVGGTTAPFQQTVTVKEMDPNNPAANAAPQADFVQVQVTIGDRTAALWVTQQ